MFIIRNVLIKKLKGTSRIMYPKTLNYNACFDTGCIGLQSCIFEFGLHFNATFFFMQPTALGTHK